MNIRIILVLIFLLLYWICHQRTIRAYINELPIHPHVHLQGVISLTTIPSRVAKITPTLYSLLDQTMPMQIHIHIPVQANCEPTQPYIFPDAIRQHPNITLIYHPTDTGPSMKFIPEILLNHHQYIIVVDDDIIYPRNLTQKLLDIVQQHPRCVYATRGNIFSTQFQYQTLQTIHSYQLILPQRVDIITGCGGYIISPYVANQLRGLIDNYNGAPQEAKLMDDIWISGCIARLGIKRYVPPGIPKYSNNFGSFFFTNAYLEANRTAKNNAVIAYFKWR